MRPRLPRDFGASIFVINYSSIDMEGDENPALDGLTVKRWCELGNSGAEVLPAIHDRLVAAPPESLAELEITRDPDGGFRIPVRTLIILGRKLTD